VEKVDRWGSTGITSLALLASLLLIGAGTSSVFLGESEDISDEAENAVNDVLKEITTYIQIKNIIGDLDNQGKDMQLKKIVVLAKPLFETTLNLSQLHIQINNGETIKIFNYNNTYTKSSDDLFKNKLWEKLNKNEYGIIILTDEDNSIKNTETLNKDLIYFAINIPSTLTIHPGDEITITLIPGEGCINNIDVEIPFSASSHIVYIQ